jgi:excisionase family DNA binding protein
MSHQPEIEIPDTPPELLTERGVALYLDVSERTVDRLVQSGMLPAYRVGGHRRFRLWEVEDYVERHPGRPAMRQPVRCTRTGLWLARFQTPDGRVRQAGRFACNQASQVRSAASQVRRAGPERWRSRESVGAVWSRGWLRERVARWPSTGARSTRAACAARSSTREWMTETSSRRGR